MLETDGKGQVGAGAYNPVDFQKPISFLTFVKLMSQQKIMLTDVTLSCRFYHVHLSSQGHLMQSTRNGADHCPALPG